MTKTPKEQLAFDTQVLDVYLTGLQAEIEAKLRRVSRFREQMRRIDTLGPRTNRMEREQAARSLIKQIGEMKETNRTVRETLEELDATAHAILEDVLDIEG